MTSEVPGAGTPLVWIAPGTTEFSCRCEPCLDRSHARGSFSLESIRDANVRGTLAGDADSGFGRCRSGHRSSAGGAAAVAIVRVEAVNLSSASG
jgi:hypothetical protein